MAALRLDAPAPRPLVGPPLRQRCARAIASRHERNRLRETTLAPPGADGVDTGVEVESLSSASSQSVGQAGRPILRDETAYVRSSSLSATSSPLPIGSVTANSCGWDFTRRR